MNSDISRHVDRKALRFLRTVEYYGGKASMTDIRQRTGLSRDAANHRFRRLEELELIEVTYANDGYGERTPPKVAHLTDAARWQIERGLFAPLRDGSSNVEEVVDIESDIRDIHKQMDSLKHRLDTLSAAKPAVEYDVEDRLNAVEAILDDLEEYVYEWDETAEAYLLALRSIVEDRGIDFDEYLRETRHTMNANVEEPSN